MANEWINFLMNEGVDPTTSERITPVVPPEEAFMWPPAPGPQLAIGRPDYEQVEADARRAAIRKNLQDRKKSEKKGFSF